MRNVIKYQLLIFALGLLACKQPSKSAETLTVSTEIDNGIATSEFKVWGNCDMCKETIEGSLKVDGVNKADWDTETKLISVNYDTSKISLDQIQKNIATAGYDNVKYKGDDNAYEGLPECCQYDRK